MSKVHLNSNDNKGFSACGGRVSGAKVSGKKQFFSADLTFFESMPVKERCVKCQAKYEEMKKATVTTL